MIIWGRGSICVRILFHVTRQIQKFFFSKIDISLVDRRCSQFYQEIKRVRHWNNLISIETKLKKEDVQSTWYISGASAHTTYGPFIKLVMSLGCITGEPVMYLELPDMSLWYLWPLRVQTTKLLNYRTTILPTKLPIYLPTKLPNYQTTELLTELTGAPLMYLELPDMSLCYITGGPPTKLLHYLPTYLPTELPNYWTIKLLNYRTTISIIIFWNERSKNL